MSLEALYASQQAAHDALVAAGVGSGARVRLPRRMTPHAGSLSMGAAAGNAIEKGGTRQIARVRFDRVVRHQWRTLTERDLPQLEVMVAGGYTPLSDLTGGE